VEVRSSTRLMRKKVDCCTRVVTIKKSWGERREPRREGEKRGREWRTMCYFYQLGTCLDEPPEQKRHGDCNNHLKKQIKMNFGD
jgi:hypothetical protein